MERELRVWGVSGFWAADSRLQTPDTRLVSFPRFAAIAALECAGDTQCRRALAGGSENARNGSEFGKNGSEKWPKTDQYCRFLRPAFGANLASVVVDHDLGIFGGKLLTRL